MKCKYPVAIFFMLFAVLFAFKSTNVVAESFSARISANPPGGPRPLTVQFRNSSSAGSAKETYLWDFGDGTTSVIENPTHTYNIVGKYTVRLTVSFPESATCSVTKTIDVKPATTVAAFTANQQKGEVPLIVQFTDQSKGDNIRDWTWGFGDGGKSFEQNPSHTYEKTGIFDVTLSIRGDAGPDGIRQDKFIVAEPKPTPAPTPKPVSTPRPTAIPTQAPTKAKPVAGFTVNKTTGFAPATVQFTDTSTNDPTSWFWEFGDGGTSDIKNPSHLYTKTGKYTVTLTAANAMGTDTIVKPNLIFIDLSDENNIAAPTVIANIDIGGPPSGNGINPGGVGVNKTTNRIYVANETSNNVSVIDGATDLVIETIPVGSEPRKVSVNPATNRIYVTNSRSDNVSVIDGSTNRVIDTISALPSPNGVAVNKATNRIYVSNLANNSGNVSVIDGSTNRIIDNITVGGSPRGVGVNEITNRVYAAGGSDDTVNVIDGFTNQVIGVVPIGLGSSRDPNLFGVGVNEITNMIYVADNNTDNIHVIDGSTNIHINSINVSHQCPFGVSVNSATNRIYIAGSCSNVNVIDGATNREIASIDMGTLPGKGIAVNPATNRIYASNKNNDNVRVIDGAANRVVHIIEIGAFPGDMRVNPTTNRIYVISDSSEKVKVIDASTNQLIDTIDIGNPLTAIGVNTATNRIYVGSNINQSSSLISVIDGATNNIIDVIKPGSKLGAIGVNSVTNRIYISESSNIAVLDGSTNQVAGAIALSGSNNIEVNPVTNRIYVSTGDTVNVINGSTNQVIDSYNFGRHDTISVNPTTNRIYIVGNQTIAVLDGSTNRLVSTIKIAHKQRLIRVAVNSTTNHIYVANSYNNIAGVIDGFTDRIIAEVDVGGAFPEGLNSSKTARGIGVNPSTNLVYIANEVSGDIAVINDGSGAQTPIITPTPAGPTPIITPTPPLTPIVTPTPTPGPDTKPRAAFKADPVSGLAPLRVKFTDESTGNPSSWIWNFGDGDLGNKKNPIHVYKTAGIYSVELTVSNSEGKDTILRENLIEVIDSGSISNCVADFMAKPESGLAPLTVNFEDLSTGKPASWTWDFGDGDLGKTRNPSHTYRKAGTYTVSLAVSTSCGEETVTKKDLISVKAGKEVIADFRVNARSGLASFSIDFEDLSSGGPESWAWDFGDGNTSGDQHPTHTYKNPGVYSPSLKVSNSNGSDAITKPELIEVESTSPPRADFTAAPQVGFGPLQVKFRDRSTGNVSGWAWDFGDGSLSSLRNPVHAYLAPGKYTVKLVASGSSGSADKTKPIIEVLEGSAPTAAFTGEPRSGFAPLTVQFKDISGGKVSSWAWDFGDGNKSRNQNPTHVYERVGVYSVKLTSSGAEGSAEKEETDFIEALDEGTAADFTADRTTRIKGENGEYLVKFKDLSSSSHGKIAKWFWSFGDKGGGASARPDPEHVFNCDNNSDVFTVSLTIFDSENNVANEVKPAFISCEEVEVVDAGAAPDITPDPNPGATLAADFRAENTSGPVPLEVRFIDESKGGPKSWSWDFGDGEESAERNPSHIYTAKGKYTVSLIVSNDSGIDTVSKKNIVNVKKGEGGKGCPASVALENEAGAPSYSRKLNALRLFRDNVIGNTVTGIKLIKYYYFHSTEVEDILNSDPELKADASEVLNRLIIELQNFSDRNTIKQVVNNFLSPGLVSDATALLDKISAKAGDELKKALVEAKDTIDE